MTKRLQIGIIQIFFSLFGAFGIVAQTVPSLINYQGKLTDQTGAPLAGGAYVIQFRLWDGSTTSGTSDLIWDQQQMVTVQTNGVFNVILGSAGGSIIPGTSPAVNTLSYAFAGSNCFLGVTITVSNGVSLLSPNEILPRQQLLSVPYAIQSSVAQSLVQNLANALCPSGTVVAYMGTNAPPGWLLCDGSAVSRTQYANLFAVIGAASGAGDGSTTFNLPDMRGVFLRGVNGIRNDGLGDPDATTLRTNEFNGGNIGNAVGSYQQDAFQGHAHDFHFYSYPASGGGDPSAQTVFTYNANLNQGPGITDFPNQMVTTPTASSWGAPRISTETRPSNVYVNYVIKD